MGPRRVVMLAMPCCEVVEVGGALDIFHAVNERLARAGQWDCLILSQWADTADDERNITWTRELHAALKPHVETAVYVNDLGDDEKDRVRSAYGENYERLVSVKAEYDPDNFFRWNQNVAAKT